MLSAMFRGLKQHTAVELLWKIVILVIFQESCMLTAFSLCLLHILKEVPAFPLGSFSCAQSDNLTQKYCACRSTLIGSTYGVEPTLPASLSSCSPVAGEGCIPCQEGSATQVLSFEEYRLYCMSRAMFSRK